MKFLLLVFVLVVVPFGLTVLTCWLEDRAAIKRGELPPSDYCY